MLSILLWALVALPLTEARFGIRSRAQNNEAVQCCPCVSSGLSPQATTVTITATASKETVTIDHTIIQSATTIFVTHTIAPGSPNDVTHDVTVHPDPPAKAETVFNAVPSSGPSTEKESINAITETIQPGDGQPESPKTVTVTVKPDEPNSVKTPSVVTVTVTPETPVSQPPTPSPNGAEPFPSSNGLEAGASTVTVTIGTRPNSSSQSTGSKPSIKTATFVENPVRPTAAASTPADTTTGFTSETAKLEGNTVIPSTMTVTIANSPSKPSVQTVPFVENSATQVLTTTAAAAMTSVGNLSNSTVQTVTFAESLPKPSSSASTRSSPSPSVQTVNFVPNKPDSTITTPSPAQLTAPPQLGTILPVTDRFTTLTQTVTSGGDVNIEITIINIFTGETICRKEGSDEPCDSNHETLQLKPSGEVPCLTTGIFTKTATAFNTVVVTVSPGLWSNGTFATGVAPPAGAATGTGSPMLRRGRVPMVRRRM